MKTFKVIDQLNIIDGELMCKNPSERSFRKAHYRQGDLDGACGAYSIIMALNILGIFEAEALYNQKRLDLRHSYDKLIQSFNNEGLYRRGLNSDDIQRLLEPYSKKLEISITENAEIIPTIKRLIDKSVPPLLRITSVTDGHWILAVGYQIDEKGNLESILTLDPSSNSPICSYWNGLLDLHRIPRKRYAYNYFSDYISIVSIDELVVIERKK